MMDSDCPLFVRVMRDVVEECQAAQTIRPYLDDVETRRQLLETIAIAARIEAEDVRDDEPDRRLVRGDEHALAWMRVDDLLKRAHCPFEDSLPRFSSCRREVEGIVLPGGVFLWIHRFRFVVAKSFPASVIDFAQVIEDSYGESVRSCYGRGGLERTLQWAAECGRERFNRQPPRQELDLQTPFRAERNIGRSRKAILGTQFRRAVSHEQDSSRHRCFHSRNPPRNA